MADGRLRELNSTEETLRDYSQVKKYAVYTGKGITKLGMKLLSQKHVRNSTVMKTAPSDALRNAEPTK